MGHGTLSNEEKPRLVSALDGMRVRKIAAGGWHSAIISQFDDLYMFGWNESGQLAQPTNLTKPAECFSAVEKLLMACCTMQPEDAALPRGDAEDCEVYHKNDEKESSSVFEASEIEKVQNTIYINIEYRANYVDKFHAFLTTYPPLVDSLFTKTYILT